MADGGNSNTVSIVMPPEGMKSLFHMLLGALVLSGLGIVIACSALIYCFAMIGALSQQVSWATTQARLAENHDMQYEAEVRGFEVIMGIKQQEKQNGKLGRR